MKLDYQLILSLIIAMVAVKVLDKLFLDKALEKVGQYEEYEEIH